jgi:hypothetical protein
MTKKKVLAAVLCCGILAAAAAEDLCGRCYVGEYLGYAEFTHDLLEYQERDFGPVDHYLYRIEYEGKVPFFSLNYGKERWLALFSEDILLLYDGTSPDYIFFGLNPPAPRRMNLWYRFKDIEVSSFLTEGSIRYSAEKLYDGRLDSPWVEGVEGWGIGETLTRWIGNGTHSIYLGNGYVSYRKPYLYEYNGRVKRLRLRDLEGSLDMIVEIEDSPNPQRIRIPEEHNQEPMLLEIEILDVYPGSRYEDTCVNFIWFEFR